MSCRLFLLLLLFLFFVSSRDSKTSALSSQRPGPPFRFGGVSFTTVLVVASTALRFFSTIACFSNSLCAFFESPFARTSFFCFLRWSRRTSISARFSSVSSSIEGVLSSTLLKQSRRYMLNSTGKRRAKRGALNGMNNVSSVGGGGGSVCSHDEPSLSLSLSLSLSRVCTSSTKLAFSPTSFHVFLFRPLSCHGREVGCVFELGRRG